MQPKEAEVMGIREALTCLKKTHISKITVEMDSQQVFNARCWFSNSLSGTMVWDVVALDFLLSSL